MTSLFIDESKENGYLIAVAMVADRDVASLRGATKKLCLPRQQRIHFTKESSQRRLRILGEFKSLGVKTQVFSAQGLADRDARAWCLDEIIEFAASVDARRIVLETDDSIVESDRRTLYQSLDRRGLREDVSYSHLRAAAEPLLWIPDAVAWSFAKGGEWGRHVEPLIQGVVEFQR